MSPFPNLRALVLIVCSFALFPFVSSLENGYKLNCNRNGRFFFFSADAPLRKALAEFKPVVKATQLILSHIARIENATIASRKSGKVVRENKFFQPCFGDLDRFKEAAKKKMNISGWPIPDVSCASDTYGADFIPDKKHLYTLDDLYDAMFKRGKIIKDNLKPIARRIVTNFTDPDFLYNCPYETQSQRCVLHPAAAFRVGDHWYLKFGVTNKSKNAHLPLLHRQSLSEHFRVVDGKLGDNLRMCHPVRGGGNQAWRNDTTTVIHDHRGAINPSTFERILIEENPAIVRAIDESYHFVQQAEDALTPSNIAILFLPLFLNLVPIALLADVSTITILLYTLMSDVLTVIPLGIKGAELISIGVKRHRSFMVRMTSAEDGTLSQSAAAAIYAAECRAHDNVLPTGIVFLVFSIVFLFGGVAAEFVARHYSVKRRNRQVLELKEAASMIWSKERFAAACAISRETVEPTSLASLDFQYHRTAESQFRRRPYNFERGDDD